MDKHQIQVEEGQSLADIAMKEYGNVAGILLLLEDNPDVLQSITDEPAVGTILSIRDEPGETFENVELVREGRTKNIIQIVEEVSGTCPTMAEQMNTSTGTQIKGALDGVSKSGATLAAYTTAEKLTHLTDGDEQELVELMSVDNVLDGIAARSAADNLDIYFSITGPDAAMLNATDNNTVADGATVSDFSYAFTDKIQFERIDAANSANYASPVFTVINPSPYSETPYSTFPFTVLFGQKLKVEFNKPAGALQGKIRLLGKYKNPSIDLSVGQYHADSNTLFGASPDPVSPSYKPAKDQLIKSLNATVGGTTAKQFLDFLHVYADESANNSKINWIQPGTFNAATSNLLPADFHVGEGWQGDAATKSIDTLFNPTAQAATCKYKQNDSAFFVWVLDNGLGNAVETNVPVFGVGGTPYATLIPRHSSTQGSATANGTTGFSSGTFSNTASPGFYFVVRSSSTQYRVYKDGVLINTLIFNSTGVPNANFRVLNLTGLGFSRLRVALCGVGGSGLEAHQGYLFNYFTQYLNFTGAL